MKNLEINSLGECWRQFHLRGVLKLPKVNQSEKNEFIGNSNVKVINSRNFKRLGLHFNWLSTIESLNSDRNKYLEFMKVLLLENRIVIPNFDLESELTCINSFGTQLFAFLAFKSGDEYFYVVQNHQIVAGVYFPSSNEYVKFSGGDINGYLKFLKKEFLNKKEHLFDVKKKFVPVFSCPRPWHFFYNQATALSILSENINIDGYEFYYVPGGDFMSPSNIDKNCIYKKTTIKELSSDLLSPVLFGVSFDSITEDEHELLRRKVLSNIKVIEKPKECIRIWVGITSQKRRWIEQTESIAAMIDLLSDNGIPFEIVFDGWTSPITPTSSDSINIESDNKIVDDIIKLSKSDFKYFSVVGELAEFKVSMSGSCDFYITNFASGSIFVSRFSGIKGLSHLNNNMNRNHHVHHNNTEISYDVVQDIHENGKVGHHVSYSIKTGDFLNEFVNFFNKLKINDLNFMRLYI